MKLLIEESSSLKESDLSNGDVFNFIERFIKENSLSLREVETFVLHLEMAQILGGNKYFTNIIFGVELLRLIGVYIYCFEKDVADDLLADKINVLSITTIFGIHDFSDTEKFKYRQNHQQVMARTLMLENPGSARGIEKRNEAHDADWQKQIEMAGYFQHGMNGHYTKIIADTIRMLRLGT